MISLCQCFGTQGDNLGYLEIAGAGVIWATTGPILRDLTKAGFNSWDMVLGRALFALTFMGLWLIAKGRMQARRDHKGSPDDASPEQLVPSVQDIPVFLALGFLAVVLSQTTYFYALSTTSVAVAVTLNYTCPFFVMIISRLVYKEPITRPKAVALLGAILGVALVSGFLGPGSSRANMSVLGALAGLMSGLAYASQTIVYKRVGVRYGPIPLNFWTMTLGAGDLLVLLTVATSRFPDLFVKLAGASLHTWLLMILLGIGPGTAAFILFADGINKVEATRGSIVAMSEPVAACILGYLLLGESLTVLQAIGVALVLTSIWAVSIPAAERNRSAPTQSQ